MSPIQKISNRKRFLKQSTLTSPPEDDVTGGVKVGTEGLSKASSAMWYINCRICTTRTRDTGISGGGLLDWSQKTIDGKDHVSKISNKADDICLYFLYLLQENAFLFLTD